MSIIKGPKNSVPTSKGWVSPKGELLKSQKISEEQIQGWESEHVPQPIQTLTEAPSEEKPLTDSQEKHFYGKKKKTKVRKKLFG